VNFTEAKARNTTPGATLILKLTVFADDYSGKPSASVCVGLRLLSEEDRRKARHVAEKQASELHPAGGDGWTECYNDAVKRQVAALAMCDPNDVTKPHELFPYAEDQVLTAFTVRGTQYVFDAVEQHEIDSSPLERLADEATLHRLAKLLLLVDIATLNGRLGRRISAMLDEVEGLVDAPESVDGAAVDDASDERPIVIGKKRLVGGAVGPGQVDVKQTATDVVAELARLTEERGKPASLGRE
jgi:hypothetical protein